MCDLGRGRQAHHRSALAGASVKGLISVSGYLNGSQEGNKSALPAQGRAAVVVVNSTLRRNGAGAGYEKNTYEFAKPIWHLASPKWELRMTRRFRS